MRTGEINEFQSDVEVDIVHTLASFRIIKLIYWKERMKMKSYKTTEIKNRRELLLVESSGE